MQVACKFARPNNYELRLRSAGVGAERVLYRTYWPSRPGPVFFLTDDLVMFTIDDVVFQISISTGKTQRIWPPLSAPPGATVIQTTDSKP